MTTFAKIRKIIRRAIKYVFLVAIILAAGKIVFKGFVDYRPINFEWYKKKEEKQFEEAMKIKFPPGGDIMEYKAILEKSGARCYGYKVDVRKRFTDANPPPRGDTWYYDYKGELHVPLNSIYEIQCLYDAGLISVMPLGGTHIVVLYGDSSYKLVEVRAEICTTIPK